MIVEFKEEKVMLKVFNLSLLCAIICAIPTLWRFISKKNKRIGTGIVLFAVDFICMAVLLYTSCIPQTYWNLIVWMWLPLTINFLIRVLQKSLYYTEGIIIATLFLVSITALLINFIFKPVQNLIYIHDELNHNFTYNISSDEVLEDVDLNIVNKNEFNDYYSVDTPEIRQIGVKEVAIYHISNKDNMNSTEYIPGYIVMEDDENPRFVYKRLYYDPSYNNGKDALRTVRREFPNVYIGKSKFDVDDSYNIYMVYEYRENFLYRKKDELAEGTEPEYGLLLLNLNNGDVNKYPEGQIPDWVDFKTTEPK